MIKSLIVLESIFPTIATLLARNLWVEHPHVEIWEEHVRWMESWFWGQLKIFLKDNLKNLERTNKLSSQCLLTLITNSLLPKVLPHKTRLRGQNLKNSIYREAGAHQICWDFQTGNYLAFFPKNTTKIKQKIHWEIGKTQQIYPIFQTGNYLAFFPKNTTKIKRKIHWEIGKTQKIYPIWWASHSWTGRFGVFAIPSWNYL